jgi:hypothetical protein
MRRPLIVCRSSTRAAGFGNDPLSGGQRARRFERCLLRFDRLLEPLPRERGGGGGRRAPVAEAVASGLAPGFALLRRRRRARSGSERRASRMITQAMMRMTTMLAPSSPTAPSRVGPESLLLFEGVVGVVGVGGACCCGGAAGGSGENGLPPEGGGAADGGALPCAHALGLASASTTIAIASARIG